MSGNRGVGCPTCGAPLEVALAVQVESRLTRRKDGSYGLGAVRQTPGEIRERLEREHCVDGKLYLGGDGDDEHQAEGEVVFCSRRPTCDFMGTVTEGGIE